MYTRQYKTKKTSTNSAETSTTNQFAPRRFVVQPQVEEPPVASRVHQENKTGMPNNLKVGIENLSGIAMDDVKVHYNSAKPSELQALAYTQGTDIHLGKGQEQHLAHEAWHIVQQKQGRVKPTMQLQSIEINDDVSLEQEADLMGQKAAQSTAPEANQLLQLGSEKEVYQFNGWEKMALVLGGAAAGVLFSWLKSKYDESEATQKQQNIIQEFEMRMREPAFRTNAEDRENAFVLSALKEGVDENVARRLFQNSGAAAKDTVTGFAPGGDRIPTVQNAIDFINKNEMARGFYVEVDIRNLGGLNSVLGHTGADEIFTQIAKMTEEQVKSLGSSTVKVASFRHGGDEFSFVVVTENIEKSNIMKNNVEQKLEAAAQKIQHEIVDSTLIISINSDAEVEKEATLATIEHPKHKGKKEFNGTGIVFGVSQITGKDTVKNVLSAADLQVELRKNK
ncbi:DUF4157 domain-containing protein [Nostoc spongiaeforme FACHB-130]|uniref:DUF4157 domain-containing protein n=1 Tax=Nostoc spongiaeforme FACHB-130 TaxID=1357510 RepID=A0ABR8FYC0_9NOSO|nr:DUF4157 domain-containing protein [Nostoc spongiaeforme]MBD2596169.1 DUF4157 domain-containing protein [Nostoc spongiaeforme FACHB-130]